MRLSVFLRRLKRNVKRKIRWLPLGFVAVAVLFAAEPFFGDDTPENRPVFSPAPDDVRLESIRQDPDPKEVYVKKRYLCGEETRYAGRLDNKEISRMLSRHPDWSVEKSEDGEWFLVEDIDEWSETCRENAYFGIDRNGHLSLFEGDPDNERILRTFFQLNIKYLESSLPHETVMQLYEGIRIRDKEEYDSVLSTFSPYAVDITEKVMKPGSE